MSKELKVISDEGLLFVIQRWSEEGKKEILAHAIEEHRIAIQMQSEGQGKAYGLFEALSEHKKAIKGKKQQKTLPRLSIIAHAVIRYIVTRASNLFFAQNVKKSYLKQQLVLINGMLFPKRNRLNVHRC